MNEDSLCTAIDDRLADLALGELPDDDRIALEAHLAICQACRESLIGLEEALFALDTFGDGAPEALSQDRRRVLLPPAAPSAVPASARIAWVACAGMAAALCVVARVEVETPSEPVVDRSKEIEASAARTETLVEDIRTLQAREEALVKTLGSVRGENLKLTTKFDQQRHLLLALNDSYVSQEKALAEENRREERDFRLPAQPRAAVQRPDVDTPETHLSTFALDVDTGSYTLARNHLENGQLPHPATVRIEEFVNAFDYGYPDPAEGAFAIHLEGAPARFGRRDEFDLRVAVQSRRIRDEDRKPAALTFVIDTSGSMEPANRLPLVKDALHTLVGAMRPDDRIAIVTYSDQAKLALEPTPAARGDLILPAIDALAAGGSTYAEAGLDLGYQVAIENFVDGAINRVILLSDGVANVGRVGPAEILARIQDRVDDGITLTTIGVGMGEYNDTLMERLADTGDGTHHYVDRIEEARRIFVEDLTGTLQTVARDAKVQVEFDPMVVSRFRLLGYENRRLANEEFRNDSVDAGEIGAGHAATAIYRLRFREGSLGAAATVRLRWQDPDSGEVHEIDRTILREDFRAGVSAASPAMQLAVAAAEFAERLRAGPLAPPEYLDDVAEVVLGLSPDLDDAASIQELADLVDRARPLVRRPR